MPDRQNPQRARRMDGVEDGPVAGALTSARTAELLGLRLGSSCCHWLEQRTSLRVNSHTPCRPLPALCPPFYAFTLLPPPPPPPFFSLSRLRNCKSRLSIHPDIVEPSAASGVSFPFAHSVLDIPTASSSQFNCPISAQRASPTRPVFSDFIMS